MIAALDWQRVSCTIGGITSTLIHKMRHLSKYNAGRLRIQGGEAAGTGWPHARADTGRIRGVLRLKLVAEAQKPAKGSWIEAYTKQL